MSFFAGCDFFMVLFILLIPAVLLGLSEKKLKWYRWLLSLFFIWEVYGSTKIQLLYLIGYVIFAAYLVKIYLYLRKKYGRNKYQLVEKVRFGLMPRRAFAFPKEKIAAPTENPLKELLCVSSPERDFFSSISR